MKVLHFYKSYLPDSMGGVELVINQIARGTANLGVSTDVLALSKNKLDKTMELDGHQVHHCKTHLEIASTPFSAAAFKRFRQLANEADLIHYQFPYPFADFLHLTANIKKPTLVTYQSDIVKQKHWLKLYRPIKHSFLRSIDHIVATSPNYLDSSDVLLRYKYKTTVIPNGIDKNTYADASKEKLAYWRQRFNTQFFLFIGVLRYYKGLQFLIEAAKSLDYPIVIAGVGPLENELKSMVENQTITNVHFLGAISEEDKAALLELCYAIVFPSHLRSEAFGMTLLEGAMHAKPLISCEIGTGTSYINIDNETGLVVPPRDSMALNEAMQTLWNNPEKAAAMGKRAEARYWKLFTAKQMAESYVDLYNKLLENRGRRP